MRALVDMSDAQVVALDSLTKERRQSRAALIHAAIDDYLGRHRRDHVVDGFGLWARNDVDGLSYEDKVRREW